MRKKTILKLLSAFLVLCIQSATYADVVWGSPVTISNTGVNASSPQVVVDPSGNATAAWLESGVVKASTLPTGGSWGTIATVSGSSASNPILGVDASGNVIATWLESGVVKSATLPSGGSWGSATSLSSSGASQSFHAVDSAGNAAAIWVRNGIIEAAKMPSGGSWSLVVGLTSSGNESSPHLAIGSDGTIIAVWSSSSSGQDNVYSTNGSVSGSWNASPINLFSDIAHHHNYPKVAVDGNGNAIASWFRYTQSGASFSNVFVMAASLPASGSSWSTPTILSTTPSLRNPASLKTKVLFDASGNGYALWITSFNGETFNVESAVLPFGGAWITGGELLQDDRYGFDTNAAINALGDVIATYMFFDGTNIGIQTAETDILDPTTNFYSNPQTISTGSQNGFPRIATGLTGTTFYTTAVWVNFNGSNDMINAATGTKTVVLAPSNVTITQSSTNQGVFTEYFNTVSWTASLDLDLSQYNIYRNGIFITSVGSGTTQFIDRNVVQNGSVTYGVAAENTVHSSSQLVTASFP